MKIEIKEKGSLEFYREVVCVMFQYFRLIKKPERRLDDSFRMLKRYIAVCLAFLLLIVVMAIAWGMDGMTMAAIILLLAAIFFSCFQYYRLNETVKTMMNDPHASIFTIDEEGVELNKEGSQLIRVAWDNVAFVRIFKESVCLFAKGPRGLIIALESSHKQQILDYIDDKHINVSVISR